MHRDLAKESAIAVPPSGEESRQAWQDDKAFQQGGQCVSHSLSRNRVPPYRSAPNDLTTSTVAIQFSGRRRRVASASAQVVK